VKEYWKKIIFFEGFKIIVWCVTLQHNENISKRSKGAHTFGRHLGIRGEEREGEG
jgi:hypothetical protein